MTQKTSVYVTTRFEGLHRYVAAGKEKQLQDVSFLADYHRHIFHVKAKIQVFHDDREVEFIQAKRKLEHFIATELVSQETVGPVVNKSCEMIAEAIYLFLKKEYCLWKNERKIMVDVSEDGENGAIYED